MAITRRLLQQFRRDRRTLALLFVVPVVILTLFYYLFHGGGTAPAMGVVNEDAGPLGPAVAHQLEASKLVDAHVMSEAAAKSGLRDGSLAGYVLLPPDFSSSAALQGRVQPEVHLEGSQPSESGAVQGAVEQAIAGAAASMIPAGVRVPSVSPEVTYLHGGPSLSSLDYLGGPFVGLVVFFMVFVVTCVAFLRERSQGTLERLMASPLRRAEIVVGYMIGFTVVALLQSLEVLLYALLVLRVYNAGNVLLIFGMETLLVLVAVNLGIFLSMFARTEFQAVQFIPLVVVPQVLLSGVIFPVSSEPGWLQWISNVLPLTYAAQGLRDVMLKGGGLTWPAIQLDAAVVFAFAVAAIAAAVATLRRRVA
jgi:ABC-2 type transport system permease protein